MRLIYVPLCRCQAAALSRPPSLNRHRNATPSVDPPASDTYLEQQRRGVEGPVGAGRKRRLLSALSFLFISIERGRLIRIVSVVLVLCPPEHSYVRHLLDFATSLAPCGSLHPLRLLLSVEEGISLTLIALKSD